jgi:two-component system LytT family response regulator
VKILVVDDERRARMRLVRLLADLEDIEAVGEAKNGMEALTLIRERRPDVVLLDIQMPGLDGFEVIAGLAPSERPLIVFVTAYDRYALRAFEVSAADYLLKPVAPERLAQALAKARQLLASGRAAAVADAEVRRVLAALTPPPHLRRVVGRKDGTCHVLPIESVEAFLAEDEQVFAVTRQGRFLVERPLKELETRLDPEQFFRAHRNCLVNLARIAAVDATARGGGGARLYSGELIEIGRRQVTELREKLGW